MAAAKGTAGGTPRQSLPPHWWWQTPGSSLKQHGQQGEPQVWWQWAAPSPRRCQRGPRWTWPRCQRESLLPLHHSRPLEHSKLTQHTHRHLCGMLRGKSGLMVHSRCRAGRPLHQEKHPVIHRKYCGLKGLSVATPEKVDFQSAPIRWKKGEEWPRKLYGNDSES